MKDGSAVLSQEIRIVAFPLLLRGPMPLKLQRMIGRSNHHGGKTRASGDVHNDMDTGYEEGRVRKGRLV